jgi:enamine deaminase RidA (YjgF/YER057c/UK114 family)
MYGKGFGMEQVRSTSEPIRRIGGTPRLSAAVVYGGMVHLSGQVAIVARGQGVEVQAHEVLSRIDALLIEAGSGRERMLSVTLLLADMASLAAVNSVWDAWLPAGAAPARTSFQTVLASPDYALEIAVIAAL